MRSTSSRARSTAVLFGVVAWLSAGTAVAITLPPGSTFKGSTNQKAAPYHEFVLKTNSAGNVARLQIGWSAPCAQSGTFWASQTVVTFRGEGDRIAARKFHDAGSYVARTSGGISGRISVRLQGKFTSRRRVQGRFSAQVDVMHAGRQIDTCSMSTRWHAVSHRT